MSGEETRDATINAVAAAIERQPDHFGVVWPDGAWYTCTEAARLFGQDEEARARLLAEKNGGRAVRIVTFLVDVDAPESRSSLSAGGCRPRPPRISSPESRHTMSARARTATAIRFEPDLHNSLVEYVDALGVSINWLVNQAVREYLASLPPTDQVAIKIVAAGGGVRD